MAKPVPYDTAIIKTGSAHQVNESSGIEYISDAGDMKEHAYEALEGRPANFDDKDFTYEINNLLRLNFALAQGYTYLGCFYDNNRRESLPDLIYCEKDTYPSDSCQNTCGPQVQYCQSQEMTIELCRDICVDQNMRYFGLQAGTQCLCGGFFAPYNVLGQPDGNDTCNRPCAGNSSQMCGADIQQSIYQINESPSDCFNPGYILNGDQSQQDSLFYNASDVIDFAPVCPPPSIKDGATSITCTASGNWTNPPPTCTVRCATPTAPMHASFGPWQTLNDSYAVDDEVFFDCDMDPSRTNQTLTCGYYGDWETFGPDCPGKFISHLYKPDLMLTLNTQYPGFHTI
ncbi:P-selectin-like [Lytechinus variegatus]|uniref:P-selectin-like n=1 Tax=Lytechinus variegatus TaxID=7654 RepID=UPI001BB23170|nr:P-selectin-like [Lytechinus variegatus]